MKAMTKDAAQEPKTGHYIKKSYVREVANRLCDCEAVLELPYKYVCGFIAGLHCVAMDEEIPMIEALVQTYATLELTETEALLEMLANEKDD